MIAFNFIVALISLVLSASLVAAHGFLAVPRPRGYNKISFQIDDLRNPNTSGARCRNEPRGSPTATLKLTPFGSLTVKLAISIGAEHIGACSLELWNTAMTKRVVLATNREGCGSRPPTFPPGTSASAVCTIPSGLVTNDMCLKNFSVKLPSLKDVDFTTGVLRWTWTARHVTPNEFYDNCADVRVQINTPTPSPTTAAPTSAAPTATTCVCPAV